MILNQKAKVTALYLDHRHSTSSHSSQCLWHVLPAPCRLGEESWGVTPNLSPGKCSVCQQRDILLGNEETNNSFPSNHWAIIKMGPLKKSSLKKAQIRVTHIISEVLQKEEISPLAVINEDQTQTCSLAWKGLNRWGRGLQSVSLSSVTRESGWEGAHVLNFLVWRININSQVEQTDRAIESSIDNPLAVSPT